MNKFNRNFPNYDDDSDYNTNANSYYKDLGRKTKLIKLLAKRIWEYDERLDNRIADLEEVLSTYLSQWDERIENLDDEVSHIFVEWLNDGTLEQIINDDVLGNKADKSFVDSEIERLEKKDENITTQLEQTTEDVESVSESLYYDSDVINWERKYDVLSETFYYITHVKHQDADGNLIKIKHHVDPQNTKTSREFADETGATLVTNASWAKPGYTMSGITMLNGEIYSYTPVTTEEQAYRYVLAIKGDNTLKVFPSTVDTNYLINNGYEIALTGFTPLIEDGADVDETLLNVYHMGDKNPRQVITQLTNKDIVFFTFGGRGYDGEGVTAEETLRIIKENFSNIETAYMLDGGGSNQTVVRGKQINKTIDDSGSSERPHANHLYFVKEKKKNIERDKDLIETNKSIGEVKYSLDVITARHKRRGYLERVVPTNFLNNWTGDMAFTLFDDGVVFISGAMKVGTKGFAQSKIYTIEQDQIMPHNYSIIQAYRTTEPTLSGVTIAITQNGTLMLKGNYYEDINEGDDIRFSGFYSTGDFSKYFKT